MEIAIDSSVLVGLLVPNDTWHSQADALWKAIESARHTSVYFDCVATETISVAARRLREKHLSAEIGAVLDLLSLQIPNEAITWILPDVPRLFSSVVDLVRSSQGALNCNDALIALACRERGINAIASFDSDFDQIVWLTRFSRPEDVVGLVSPPTAA